MKNQSSPRPVLAYGALLATVWTVLLLLNCNLFRGEPVSEPELLLHKEGHHLCEPSPSVDGTTIFYLDDSNYTGYGDVVIGELRAYRIVDSTDFLILPGQFRQLAASRIIPILAVTWKDTVQGQKVPLMILDTSGTIIETLRVSAPNEKAALSDVKFSRVRNAIILSFCQSQPPKYPDRTYYYIKGIGGDTTTTLLLELPWYETRFDVLEDDSIFVETVDGSWGPSVNPVNDRWVLSAHSGDGWLFFGPKWAIYDRYTRKIRYLDPRTVPPRTYLDWPCWMPSGRDFVFSAGKRIVDGPPPEPADLWILRDAFEP